MVNRRLLIKFVSSMFQNKTQPDRNYVDNFNVNDTISLLPVLFMSLFKKLHLQFISVALLFTSSLMTTSVVHAANPSYVKSVSTRSSGQRNNLSATFSGSVLNGDLVVVATSTRNSSNSASVTSVVDNKGNTYQKVVENGAGSAEPIAIWYARNVIGGGSFTVTINTNQNAYLTLAIHEYSGVDSVSPLDQYISNNSTGISATSGPTAVTTYPNEIVFGAFNFSNSISSVSGTAGSGFSLRQSRVNNSQNSYSAIYTEDMTVNTLGQYIALLTYSRSVNWRAAVVTFKGSNTTTPTPTLTPTPTPSLTPTVTPTPTSTVTPTPTSTVSVTPTPTPTPTPPTGIIQNNFFKVGIGYSDVITRQLVRTNTDKVYMFSLYSTTSNTILVYWTDTPGVPLSGTDFTGHIQFNLEGQPISVDPVYDGGTYVHVLINMVNPGYDPANRQNATGTLFDYPFDLSTNSFKPRIVISTDNPVRTSLPIGTAGVSGMFARDGTLNLAYWSAGDHITYVSYSYDPILNFLMPFENPTQLDTTSSGYSNHPALVISPLDGTVTVAWVWQNSLSNATDSKIYARMKIAGIWNQSVAQVNSSAFKPWVDMNDNYTDLGLNVDQGPSMVVSSDGIVHLSYNESAYANQDYGRVHYVKYTPQSSWIDTTLIDGNSNYYFTHDPSITIDAGDQIYLFGHSDWRNSSPCTPAYPAAINCYMKLNSNSTWTTPFAVVNSSGTSLPPSGENFDDSVSMKWGVVGWNRPQLVEFAFFSGQTSNYWNMNLYYGTLGGPDISPTPTPTIIPTPPVTPSLTPTPTETPLETPTPTLTPTPTSTPTPAPSLTPTPTITPTPTLTPTPSLTPMPTPTATLTPTPTPGFPTTPLLDDFNRTNGSIGTNWQGKTGAAYYAISGNTLSVIDNTGATDDVIIWKDVFAADQEVSMTITTAKSSAIDTDLILKAQGSTGASPMLEIWNRPNLGRVEVWTYDSINNWRQWGTYVSATFASGDKIGARAYANGDVKIYKNGVQIGSTISIVGWPFSASTGKVGLWTYQANGVQIDDFFGGSISSQ